MSANNRLHGSALLERFGLGWQMRKRQVDGRTDIFETLQRRELTPQVRPEFGPRDAQQPLELDCPPIGNVRTIQPLRDLRLRDPKSRRKPNLPAGKLDRSPDCASTRALGSLVAHAREFITANDITSTTTSEDRKVYDRNMSTKTFSAGFYERLTEAAKSVLGERVKQNELADLFGVTQATVSQNWTRDRLPQVERLCEMANVLNVRLEWLAFGRGTRDLIDDDNPTALALMKLHAQDPLFRELVKHWQTMKDDVPGRVFTLQAAQLSVAKNSPAKPEAARSGKKPTRV